MYACLTLYACRLSFSLTKGSHCEHYKANFHSPLRNVVLDGLSRDPKRMLCFLSLRTRSSYHFLVVCICLRFLEIEALAGLLRVAPAAMVTSIGSISVFSSSDLSASNCDASHCSKYQDGGRAGQTPPEERLNFSFESVFYHDEKPQPILRDH